RAIVLDQQRWIVPALAALALPMLLANLSSAMFLLGIDGALPFLTWFADSPRVFDTSFATALAANLLIVLEGVGRFRANQDPNERRRIQIIVFTGVPAVFAYAVKAGVPLLTGLLGQRVALPWPLEATLQAIILLPAAGLAYAVAVRHVFSPPTVLRQSLQYALAKKTLRILIALPVLALTVSLAQQRDQPLATIVGGQPDRKS